MGLVTADKDERDEAGNFVLRKPLTLSERESLTSRAKALAPWLAAPTSTRDHQAEALQLIISFGGGSSLSRTEAAALAATYVDSLKDIPIWAVRRACKRFRDGLVTADELGIASFDTSFRPSTAQVRKIAVELVRPFGEESTRIWMTLRGTIAKPIDSKETRQRVADDAAAFVNARREKEERDFTAKFEESRRENLARSVDFNRIAILREYENAGITPPEPLYSLSMAKSLGWTVEAAPGGRRILVKPPEPPRTPGRGARGGESS